MNAMSRVIGVGDATLGRVLRVAGVLLFVTTAVFASDKPETLGEADILGPESVGMSSEELKRLDDFFEGVVGQGTFAGIAAMVGRRGQVVYEGYFGRADIEAERPIQADTLFRIDFLSYAAQLRRGNDGYSERQLLDPTTPPLDVGVFVEYHGRKMNGRL